MKKLILIFGTFLIICVIVSSVANNRVESLSTQDNTQLATTDEYDDMYTVKSENGRIVVYKGEELMYRTSTNVSTLPKIDQRRLLYGITAKTQDEVTKLLQEYCS